jgi:hypothetical protein
MQTWSDTCNVWIRTGEIDLGKRKGNAVVHRTVGTDEGSSQRECGWSWDLRWLFLFFPLLVLVSFSFALGHIAGQDKGYKQGIHEGYEKGWKIGMEMISDQKRGK